MLSQTDRATLRGTVTDPSGSVVPSAQVLIQEVGTNVERKLTTDENGNYEAPALSPGHYLVKVETKGFRGFQAEDILLDAGVTRRFDIALQVGATTESVTVTGGAQLIQTENGAISGELDKKQFLDRPVVDVYLYGRFCRRWSGIGARGRCGWGVGDRLIGCACRPMSP